MKKTTSFMMAAILSLGLVSTQSAFAEPSEEVSKNFDYMFHQIAQKLKVLLENDPKFLPFGAGMNASGKVQFIWTDNKMEYTADGAMLLVRRALKANAEAGRLLGVATIYRYIHEGGDEQVNVELEYASGDAEVRAIELIGKEGEKVVGSAARQAMEPKIFTSEVVKKLQVPATTE